MASSHSSHGSRSTSAVSSPLSSAVGSSSSPSSEGPGRESSTQRRSSGEPSTSSRDHHDMVHPSATADDVSLEGQRHTLDAASPRPPQPAAAAAKGTGEVAADHEGSPHRHDDPGAKGAVVSTSLHDVYVQYCSEHGLPPLPQLCSAMAALTANSGVRDLTLCNVTIGPSQASALGASLTSPAGSSSQLASITLSHAYLCDEGALSVLRAIGSWPASARSAVHTLDLTGNGLRDAAAIARLSTLLPRLSKLLLEFNKLGAA